MARRMQDQVLPATSAAWTGELRGPSLTSRSDFALSFSAIMKMMQDLMMWASGTAGHWSILQKQQETQQVRKVQSWVSMGRDGVQGSTVSGSGPEEHLESG